MTASELESMQLQVITQAECTARIAQRGGAQQVNSCPWLARSLQILSAETIMQQMVGGCQEYKRAETRPSPLTTSYSLLSVTVSMYCTPPALSTPTSPPMDFASPTPPMAQPALDVGFVSMWQRQSSHSDTEGSNGAASGSLVADVSISAPSRLLF